MSVPSKSLTGHVSTLIAHRFAANPRLMIGSIIQTQDAALLVVDISFLTTLTGQLKDYGPAGSEKLTNYLKNYFEKVTDILIKHGGDIIRFTGNTLTVIWSTETFTESLETVSRRAAQCAIDLQISLPHQPPSANLTYSLKVGLSSGKILTTDLGGVYGRWEFLVTGDHLIAANQACQQAQLGEIFVTSETWPYLQAICTGEVVVENYVRLDTISPHLSPSPQAAIVAALTSQAEAALRGYIPGAFLTRLGSIQTSFFAEILPITAVIVNLPGVTYHHDIEYIQTILRTLQTTLYEYEGSVDRITLDNNGTTFISILGLPPVAHDNDVILGVQAALAMQTELEALNITGTIGVTTGRAFCGLVGNEQRHEYTIVGQVVYLAEQLAHTTTPSQASDTPLADADSPASVTIRCDSETYQLTQGHIEFNPPETISITGVEYTIYQPTVDLAASEAPPPPDMESWMKEIYEQFR